MKAKRNNRRRGAKAGASKGGRPRPATGAQVGGAGRDSTEVMTPSRFALVLFGTFAVSCSVITFEIALSRLFSVVLAYHYAFVAVSLAISGMAAGALFIHYNFFGFGKAAWAKTLPLLAALFGASSVGFVVLITRLPIVPGVLFVYAVFASLPFAFAGAFLSIVFRLCVSRIHWVYAADLVGAGVGGLVAVALLEYTGGVNAALAPAVGAMAAAIGLFAARPRAPRVSLPVMAVTAAALAVFVWNVASGFLGDVPVSRDTIKDLYNVLSDPEAETKIVDTRWSSFGRTDLVETSTGDVSEFIVFIDAAAGSTMYPFNGDLENPNTEVRHIAHHFSGFFPFYFLEGHEKDNALIIGPGAGKDVLAALLGGVKEITAVEVNPQVVEIVRDYSDYNGGIYTDFSNVEVIIAEGRSFLRNDQSKYDIILMSIPITKSSRSIEGYALTENFLFTTDAIRDYLDHLTPEGRLIIVAHHFPEVLRLTSISLAALADTGISNVDAMKMIYTVGKKMKPLFVLKRTPFTAEESQDRHTLMHAIGFDSTTSYIPHIPQETARIAVSPGVYKTVTMFSKTLVALADGQLTLEEFVSKASIDLSPVTDDRPFFYKWKRGMVSSVLAMLVLSAVVSVGVIVIPAIRVRSIDGRRGGRWRLRGTAGLLLGIVAFLGTAYMTIEIALFQRFILFTGNPTLSFAVILSCLLVGSGIGSLLTASATRRSAFRRLLTGALLAALISFAYLFLLPTVFAAALGASQTFRLLLSGVLIFPLGLVMGMPFPATLRLLGFDGAENRVPWAYAINAATSVLGSVLAISLAMAFGFSTALVTGSFLYLAVAVFGIIVARRESHKLEPVMQVASRVVPTPAAGE